MLRRATGIEGEVQITAVDGDRLLHIVVEKPSILEQETMDAQLKQGVLPALFGRSRPFRCRHVARAIFAHEDMHMRLPQQKLVERDSPAPKGIDTQRGLNFTCAEQRLGSGWLVSVNHQATDGYAQGQPANGHRSQFGSSAGRSVQAAYEQPLEQGIATAASEKGHHAQDAEHGKYPRRVDDPAPNRVAASL